MIKVGLQEKTMVKVSSFIISISLMLFFTTKVFCQSITEFKIEGNMFCGMIKVSDTASHIGFIDSTGKLIIPCQYYKNELDRRVLSTDFTEGYSVVVRYDSIQGFIFNWIDTKGITHSSSDFKYCSIFHNGVAWCVDRNKRIYDAILVNDSISINIRNDKHYLSNKIYYKPSEMVVVDSAKYLNRCKLYTLKDSLIGEFVTTDVQLKSDFIQVYDCISGKWGLIDSKGNFILDYISDLRFSIYDEFILIKIEGNYYVYDRKNCEFYHNVYKTCNLFSDYFICQDMTGKYDVFGYKGQLLKGLNNSQDIGCYQNEKFHKYGFQDVVDPIYDNYINFNEEGYALVRKEGKASIIDKEGKVIISER